MLNYYFQNRELKSLNQREAYLIRLKLGFPFNLISLPNSAFHEECETENEIIAKDENF